MLSRHTDHPPGPPPNRHLLFLEVHLDRLYEGATVTADDIGLPQQIALYDELCATSTPPPIPDAGGFLRAPEAHLRILCEWLGIPFTGRMLHWPQGPRASDGIRAPYSVRRCGNRPASKRRWHKEITLSGAAAEVAEECRPHYERLHGLRMRVR